MFKRKTENAIKNGKILNASNLTEFRSLSTTPKDHSLCHFQFLEHIFSQILLWVMLWSLHCVLLCGQLIVLSPEETILPKWLFVKGPLWPWAACSLCLAGSTVFFFPPWEFCVLKYNLAVCSVLAVNPRAVSPMLSSSTSLLWQA